MANSTNGKASWMSPSRISTVSTVPPQNPATTPTANPSRLPRMTAQALISSE
jgi:hypothetical protein